MCQSQAKMIGQDFVVPIGQIFPIQIVQWPEKLTVQIIEGMLIFFWILLIERKRNKEPDWTIEQEKRKQKI